MSAHESSVALSVYLIDSSYSFMRALEDYQGEIEAIEGVTVLLAGFTRAMLRIARSSNYPMENLREGFLKCCETEGEEHVIGHADLQDRIDAAVVEDDEVE